MRSSILLFAILLLGCGSERNIEYEIKGSGSKGLTISYLNEGKQMVSVTNATLPWSKWVAMETDDTAEVTATCSYSGLTERNDGECCLGSGAIKNPDNITLESDKTWGVGCSDKVHVKFNIYY